MLLHRAGAISLKEDIRILHKLMKLLTVFRYCVIQETAALSVADIPHKIRHLRKLRRCDHQHVCSVLRKGNAASGTCQNPAKLQYFDTGERLGIAV